MDGSGSGSWFIELEGRRVDLRSGEYTLGRSRGCGVVLRDPSVSRGHALLSVRDGTVTLQDLQSSNGTYVNGRRLEAEVRLAPGDRVIVGETELFLRRQAAGLDGVEGGAAGGPPTAEHALFCPACGTPLPAGAAGCEACGRPLGAERTPRRSEALALGEVLPVGEVLGAASGSWDETRFRQGMAAQPRPTGPAAAVMSEPHPTRATAEVRVPLPDLPPPDAGRASLRRRMVGAWRVLLGRDDELPP